MKKEERMQIENAMNEYPCKIRVDVDIEKNNEIIERLSFFGKTENAVVLSSQYLSKKVITGIDCKVSIVGIIDMGDSTSLGVFQFKNYILQKETYNMIAEKIRLLAEEMQNSLNPEKNIEVFKNENNN